MVKPKRGAGRPRKLERTSTAISTTSTDIQKPRGRPPKSSPIKKTRGRPSSTIEKTNTSAPDIQSDEYDFRPTNAISPHCKRLSRAQQEKKNIIGSAIDIIPAQRLPTRRVVLRRWLGMRLGDTNMKNSDIGVKIAKEVACIWTKAKLPIKPQRSIVRMFVKLIDSWDKVRNIRNIF